ncbi:MAG: hypothetical protein ACFFED_18440 [Candidatus Thorarchaeota archaeon]
MSDENEIEVKPPVIEDDTEKENPRRPFNPMTTYFEFAAGIFAIYVLYYLLGIEFLVIGTLAVLVFIFRETYYILEFYSYGFARKASIFNALHATAWFIVLAINGFSIMQTGIPAIFPDLESLTLTAPLFVLMAAFGCKNIERMYKPSDEMILAKKR